MEATVYENIRRIRIEKKISQENMANQLSISQAYYSKIERGLKSITLKRLIRIGEILDIEPQELLKSL